MSVDPQVKINILQDRVRVLENQIELKDEEIVNLKKLLHGDKENDFSILWDLSPSESAVLNDLHKSFPNHASNEKLLVSMERFSHSDYLGTDSIKVLMSKLRSKMQTRGINIITLTRRGYYLDKESYEILSKALTTRFGEADG